MQQPLPTHDRTSCKRPHCHRSQHRAATEEQIRWVEALQLRAILEADGATSMIRWFKTKQAAAPLPTRPIVIDAALFDGEGKPFYQALAAAWKAADPNTYEQDEDSPEIAALERRYSIRLPEDFRSYLLHAVPKTKFIDDIGTQWWSLAEIKSIPDECPDGPPGQINEEIESEKHTYLIFSDYLIWCYAWAICCSDGPHRGKVALIGGSPDAFVADSFREFVRLELSDAQEIHQGAKR